MTVRNRREIASRVEGASRKGPAPRDFVARAEQQRVTVGRRFDDEPAPIVPVAPGRLSITTGWPKASFSFCARGRANESAGPPGGNGTRGVSALPDTFAPMRRTPRRKRGCKGEPTHMHHRITNGFGTSVAVEIHTLCFVCRYSFDLLLPALAADAAPLVASERRIKLTAR